MNRIWLALPIAIMAAVPLWSNPSTFVFGIELLAILLCISGVLQYSVASIGAGAGVALIGYALALWSSADRVDVISATGFGLALLSLLDIGEFARRFRGAAVASSVIRAQTKFWAGRAAVIFGAVTVFTFLASGLAAVVPDGSRAVFAGLGAVVAFAGALYAGIAPPRT